MTMLKTIVAVGAVSIAATIVRNVDALAYPPRPSSTARSVDATRASFFRDVVTTVVTTGLVTAASPAVAVTNVDPVGEKRKKISDEELKKIVTADMTERSFLVSADLTRDVYDERSIFTDEIDSYTIDKWVKGTKALFVTEGSTVNLEGDVTVSPDKVEFRFHEDLMFRIPFRPVVTLSGKVLLTRDTETGLITSYREFWDQSVPAVLQTAKFGQTVRK